MTIINEHNIVNGYEFETDDYLFNTTVFGDLKYIKVINKHIIKSESIIHFSNGIDSELFNNLLKYGVQLIFDHIYNIQINTSDTEYIEVYSINKPWRVVNKDYEDLARIFNECKVSIIQSGKGNPLGKYPLGTILNVMDKSIIIKEYKEEALDICDNCINYHSINKCSTVCLKGNNLPDKSLVFRIKE